MKKARQCRAFPLEFNQLQSSRFFNVGRSSPLLPLFEPELLLVLLPLPFPLPLFVLSPEEVRRSVGRFVSFSS
jgi:hypothetical protein